MIRYNLKMKVFTFATVKIRLLQKSNFAQVEMVDFCKSRAGRAAQRNYFELDFDFDFCKKWQKPGPFFGKARENFGVRKHSIRRYAYVF